MQDGNMEEATRVLDNKFHLMTVYPKRSRFHVSEHMAFCSTVGYYFFHMGNFTSAAVYLDGLMAVDPDDARTQRLKKIMEVHGFLMSKLKGLVTE